ncbi:ATP synthase subunit d, mitochondrial [Eupeodes corollae]|uniref:ATP synthase subunit d, mitochondrial n=1 Tax=Eupeodes corollae TaxID=290404 RepID=UPI00248FFA7A|nr:ATP synthase subunit d, mitochondrial [Eupeodes corollae]XP_055907291.1 ATP synthase subunit d, mitochondrial [Eupeodes corollae]XP_055907292.1 ATP synthase subunit d, mitochondrial [Eupeodes corollae]
MAKRLAQSSINWAALAERVPPNQKANFQSFKTKSDVYMRAVMANPENPPKIDWAQYKAIIPIPGLVDKFQKQYEALKIPYPADNVTAQVEAQAKETKAEIESFKKASNERIAKFQKDIEHLKSLLPYDQMTMEDYRDAFPEEALDPINRPTFWPHAPEDQLGHVDKNAQPSEGH